jgi:hypothetical protein
MMVPDRGLRAPYRGYFDEADATADAAATGRLTRFQRGRITRGRYARSSVYGAGRNERRKGIGWMC